ncbi:N-6 DNA methylase [Micromonospora chersina]|uniref:N-6 DNA methylase n=1 Tax=Micromonospora chersina TaxID=47854 RepID=UPI00379310A4
MQTLARDLLAAVGYGANHVRSDVPALVGELVVRADFVAFGRLNGPFDASTATIVVEFVDDSSRLGSAVRDRLGQIAVALSAPALIVADLERWTLFAVEADGGINQVRELAWTADPGELREVLSPRRLLEAKLGNRQLSLFPAAATVSARGRWMRHDALAPRVESALSSAADVLLTAKIADKEVDAHTRAARAVIGALTTVVLRDKHATTMQRHLPADLLLNRALVAHPQQFRWLSDVLPAERELTETLVEHFVDVDFTTIEPMLLSELYEKRLVDDALRRRLGTHYTPPGLARRILDWLPIEELHPDERSVYDPTCGSGSLLVAAHDRLRSLQPEAMTPDRSHAQLVTMIRGADTDPVAVAIADLALFLNAIPAGNGWQVEQRDFFTNSLVGTPAIVVANPPWEYDNQDRQDDQAQRILTRLITHLPAGGLLGVILPAGWLSRRSPAARASRAQLFGALDVLELWRLPEGTFPNARLGAAVALARKPGRNRQVRRPIVFRRISHRADLQAFYDQGANQCVLSWKVTPEELGNGPLHTWLKSSRRDSYTLGDYATAKIGPQPESQERLAARSTRLPPNAAFVRWDKVAAFSEVHEAPSVPMRFPDDMQDASRRGAELLGRPKVLVSGVKDPERPWRIKVAIDTIGDLLVRNTVTAVLPRRDIGMLANLETLTEEELFYGLYAFLGSGFVSAWLDESTATRYMSTSALLSVPAPDPRTLRGLSRLGKRMLSPEGQAKAIDDLEQQVWEWLQIPENIRALVIERLNETDAPERRRRYQHLERRDSTEEVGKERPSSRVVRPRAGVVLSVEDQHVTLAIPGLTPSEGKAVLMPRRMPGALLIPGASMVVLDDGGPLEEMTFLFDEVAYLSDDQLSAEFAAFAER